MNRCVFMRDAEQPAVGVLFKVAIDQDCQRHGLTVLPIDVTLSEVNSTLIETGNGQPHLRLGLNRVKSLGLDAAQRVVIARKQQAFIDTRYYSQRTALDRSDLQHSRPLTRVAKFTYAL